MSRPICFDRAWESAGVKRRSMLQAGQTLVRVFHGLVLVAGAAAAGWGCSSAASTADGGGTVLASEIIGPVPACADGFAHPNVCCRQGACVAHPDAPFATCAPGALLFPIAAGAARSGAARASTHRSPTPPAPASALSHAGPKGSRHPRLPSLRFAGTFPFQAAAASIAARGTIVRPTFATVRSRPTAAPDAGSPRAVLALPAGMFRQSKSIFAVPRRPAVSRSRRKSSPLSAAEHSRAPTTAIHRSSPPVTFTT